MNHVATINVALDAFAFISMAIITVSMLFDKNRRISLNHHFIRILWCYLFALFVDILCWVFDGSLGPQIRYVLLISNFCFYAFSVLGAAAYHHYIIAYISTKTSIAKTSVSVVNALCVIYMLLLMISQFNHMFYYIDETNRYCRGDLFVVAYIMPTFIAIYQIAFVLRYRKQLGFGDTFTLLLYNILLFTGVVLQAILNLLMLLNVLVSIGLFIVYIRIQVEQAKKLETDLTNARVDAMLSQIQPHFLYNTLATIEAVCYEDSEITAKLVRDFAKYLRENMDSLTQKELVSFNRELEHIKIYLNIEKVRFEEQLNIVYDLKTTDFRLPILTIQPLVENAVRYGANTKLSGGTVTIRTETVQGGVRITVADDGSGINTEQSKASDGSSHIGIENARERLRLQCGGTLTVESTLGKGCVSTVFVPQMANTRV